MTGGFGTWHTSDGREFASQSEAERHERRAGLASDPAPKGDGETLKMRVDPLEKKRREGLRQAQDDMRKAQKDLTPQEREAALRGVGEPKQRPTSVPLAETREEKLARQAAERKAREKGINDVRKLQRAVDDASPEAQRAKAMYGATTSTTQIDTSPDHDGRQHAKAVERQNTRGGGAHLPPA
jgi:ribosomal protein S7